MFFTILPAKEINFDFPADKLGAIWISITDIQPEGGAVNVYSNPLDRPMDVEHAGGALHQKRRTLRHCLPLGQRATFDSAVER